MKRWSVTALVFLALAFFFMNAVAAEQTGKMETAFGKVTAIDPQGKGITISEKAGKESMDVGCIVDKDTVIKIKGKKESLDDLKVGDTVTIHYLRSNDLYAKEIVKK